jgi:Leucine-rich repeat (LRR) protein
VETLVNLRKLDVNNNELRDLSGISKLNKLENLYAQGNELGVAEPFDDRNDNGSLDQGEEYEDISGNGIWDGDPLPELDKLPHLRNVYLYSNGLSDLSKLGDLPVLMTLLLGVNEITDVSPLKKFTSLRHLSLNRNQVTDIGGLVGLDALMYLDLSGNRLSDLRPLRQMKSLRSLLLNDNNLTDLRPLAEHPHLESLSFNSNLVTDLRPLANLKKLRNLDAGRNLIDLESEWNLPVAEALPRSRGSADQGQGSPSPGPTKQILPALVRSRMVSQGKTIDGLRELGEVLIGDKVSNFKLGVYLEENGYARLRDYHADTQVAETQKADNYREWIKAIRSDQIAELPRLMKR